MDNIISPLLKSESFSFAWRIFLDEFYRNPGENMLSEPTVLQNRKDKAFMAATVHRLARTHRLNIPSWVFNEECFLDEPYFLEGKGTRLQLLCLVESPPEFKMRNIFVTENVLSRT